MSITNLSGLFASFDVDAQNCFTPRCPDELPVPEGDQIVAELNRQAQYARFRIGSKDAHPENALWVATHTNPQLTPLDHPHADTFWNCHAVPGSFGFELIEGLPHPNEYDFFIWKGVEPDMHPYGACYHDLAGKQSTGVIEFLTVHSVRHVIVGGLATDYCVKTTVCQLLDAGFDVILNLAACRGIAPDTTQAAIETMQQRGVILIDNSDALKPYSEI